MIFKKYVPWEQRLFFNWTFKPAITNYLSQWMLEARTTYKNRLVLFFFFFKLSLPGFGAECDTFSIPFNHLKTCLFAGQLKSWKIQKKHELYSWHNFLLFIITWSNSTIVLPKSANKENVPCKTRFWKEQWEGWRHKSCLYYLLVQHLALQLPELSETCCRCPEFSAGYGE